MSSATPASHPEAPPEVDATLTRLTAHKNVKGVLILSRPSGIILRSAGALFATLSTPALPAAAEDDDAPRVTNGVAVTTSELTRAYAKLAVNVVQSVGAEVREVEAGDNLRFLRIRTKKHELMITPDDLYILVVVQDPN